MEQNWITSDDILGKDVIDTNGTFLGVVDKLFLTPDTIAVQAISVDKGFLAKGLVISKSYIERVSKYAVFLKIEPSFLLQDKKVYSAKGLYVGTVAKIVQSDSTKNHFDHIVVKARSGKKEIKADEIAQIGKNVVLK